MKPLLTSLAAALLMSLAAPLPGLAADAAKPLTASQQRMADCNKEAGDRRGAERRDFMRQCMHGGGKPGAVPAMPATPAAPASAATPATPATPAVPATPPSPAEPAKMTQQERMRYCNQAAGDKRGPDRRSFMSECLKGR
ncbi:MAG: PsiF family protein [Pseudomonadota bacterium]